MRPGLALVTALALILVACGGGHDDKPTARTSTTARRSTTTLSPTSAPTTTAAAECGPVSVPKTATEVATASGDVDGDGANDVLRSYLVGESDWHLQVALAAGGGADVAIATFSGGSVSVLGGADVDGDGADEIWARTGSGASATILGLARFASCGLARVTFAAGDPAELPVGGSVGSASGLECASHVDPTADLTAYDATNTTDDQYEVRATEYALNGTTLTQLGTKTTTATAGDDAFGRATSFACHGLGL
jgi:hypothetical protein